MTTAKRNKMLRQTILLLLRYCILIGVCFVILYPLFTKVMIAFMEKRDLYDSSVMYIPKHFTLANIKVSVKTIDYLNTFLKTVLMVGSCSVLQVLACMLTGYGFARFKIPFGKLFFACVIVILIVPIQTIVVPLYLYFSKIKLIGTVLPLFLFSVTCMGMKNGLFIYLFRQFFRGFPKELEEAGQIDGAGTFRIFSSIIAPSSVSMTVTCFLFSFVWQWTDSYYMQVFMPNMELLPIQIQGLATRISSTSAMATGQVDLYYKSIINNVAILLLIIPLVILYCFTQRYFVESFERSGIVG